MRKRTGILMDRNGKPLGGEWNFDKDNRKPLKQATVDALPQPRRFKPDRITSEVIAWINAHLADHPGKLDAFAWPVCRSDALAALDDFIRHRLPQFGDFQDAMWREEPFLFHSLIASALNLKLLHPREVIDRAVQAYHDGDAPINAVEGFVRQILGWREYVRGIYWWQMPRYADLNALQADQPLPGFYWDADTPMECLSQSISQTLDHGYAHHIQRLMVTGLYSLLLGVRPQEIHQWYLAVYIDAVEWVELPNTLGMSQFADGGWMASKPYVATGKYIQRMSNYCASCRFNPAEATGTNACPFTTLYWDFLMRHESSLRANPRMRMQLRNLERLDADRREAIKQRAAAIRNQPNAQFN
jgi:deoxyribodipyrimidine photolyase-related protein